MAYELIQNYEKVTSLYGSWPSFHDSEVISIRLDRDQGEPLTGPALTMEIHLFRVEVSPNDERRHNSLLTLRFKEVQELRLIGFNHQNAINSLVISQRYSKPLNRDVFVTEVKPAFGIDCSFECSHIEVVSVEPFTPKWGAWAAQEHPQ